MIGQLTQIGDGQQLIDALARSVSAIRRRRSQRDLIRRIEQAHGRVVEVAEQIEMAECPGEELFAALDAAMVCYQRRVALLCFNRK